MFAVYNKVQGEIYFENKTNPALCWKANNNTNAENSYINIKLDSITDTEIKENKIKDILLMIYTTDFKKGHLFKFRGEDKQLSVDKITNILDNRHNDDVLNDHNTFNLKLMEIGEYDKNILIEIFSNIDWMYVK